MEGSKVTVEMTIRSPDVTDDTSVVALPSGRGVEDAANEVKGGKGGNDPGGPDSADEDAPGGRDRERDALSVIRIGGGVMLLSHSVVPLTTE